MKKYFYYLIGITVAVLIMVLFAPIFNGDSNAAPGDSKEVARYQDAIKNHKPILVGFYSPT